MKINDFSQNFNVVVNKDKYKKILETSSDQLFRYPQWNKQKIIKLIAKSFGVSQNSIAIGNGTSEIIFTLPKVLDNKNVLILSPNFWEYPAANKIYKEKKIIFFPLKETDDFQLNYAKFESKIKKFSTVYLCNPNNPTSTLLDKTSLVDIIKRNTTSIFIVDETYLIFREDYEKQSLINESVLLDNLYVVTSFSKIFSMPGLRIGVLISKPINIENYNKFTIPYLINPMAEIIIPYLLKQKNLLQETRKFYSNQRMKAYTLFLKNFHDKLEIFKPEANFMLVKIISKDTSQEITNKLKKEGIILRDGSEFKYLGNKWLRTAIKTDEEMSILVTSLKKIFDKK